MTKPFLTLISSAFLALVLLMPAAMAQKAAPEPDRLAAAREFLDAAGTAKQFEAVMPMMMNQMQGLFIKMRPGNEKDIKEVFGVISKRFMDRRGEVFDEIAVLYAEKLTAAELREIAAFFKSGVGAKFITLQPELAQQSMIIGQRWGERIGREVDSDVRKELKKRGVDL